jgi:hypothetical protein
MNGDYLFILCTLLFVHDIHSESAAALSTFQHNLAYLPSGPGPPGRSEPFPGPRSERPLKFRPTPPPRGCLVIGEAWYGGPVSAWKLAFWRVPPSTGSRLR